ncbi:MAG: acyl-CoA thioesterase/BAAT N-terminal domain-containing protein [Gammaproteobacteria bacterium]|nr:acyl-CoA thioesterase/BAAT N-terminal domain-containing protein [Gammaproteobacteria bacterium]
MPEIIADSTLITTPLNFKVVELIAYSSVTLTAEITDQAGRSWRSLAEFKANADGIVDLAEQAPIKGTYHHADVSGLFWSMRPDAGDQHDTLFTPNDKNALNVTVKVFQENKLAAEKIVSRYYRDTAVSSELINNEFFNGKIYYPEAEGPSPAIILCSGSGGGIDSQQLNATVLASAGYMVLVVAYYNYQDLADELYEVPLDPIVQAIEWLNQHDKVSHNKIVLMAPSKGAEAVLLAAALAQSQAVAGVIAISPSILMWQGFGKGRPENKSSWSYQGQATFFVKINELRLGLQILFKKLLSNSPLAPYIKSLLPLRLIPAYLGLKSKIKKSPKAVIPVTAIAAPLLLIAGEKDSVWPASNMAKTIQILRQDTGFKDDEVYIYSRAGHAFRLPYQPTAITWSWPPGAKFGMHFGGSPQANAEAANSAWQHILDFLKKVTA